MTARSAASFGGRRVDLLVAAGRERTILLSGFLAGVCVFFAPMVVLGIGLLAAYLADVASDGTSTVFTLARPLEREDFRAVFAPAIHDVGLLVTAGVVGMAQAQFRRWLARRADPAFLVMGIRPFFPEFAALYVLLTVTTLAVAALRGGWPQVHRLLGAAPVFLFFMICATWLAHAVWQYCFTSVLDLVATGSERDAATALGAQARVPRARRNGAW